MYSYFCLQCYITMYSHVFHVFTKLIFHTSSICQHRKSIIELLFLSHSVQIDHHPLFSLFCFMDIFQSLQCLCNALSIPYSYQHHSVSSIIKRLEKGVENEQQPLYLLTTLQLILLYLAAVQRSSQWIGGSCIELSNEEAYSKASSSK